MALDTYSYHTAVGLRGIGTSGLTVKHFTKQDVALEGIVGLWSNAISATLLYEKHANAFDVEGLRWYYGGGGHVVARTHNHNHHKHYYEHHIGHDNGAAAFGLDGIIGIEYKIKPIPFAVSADLKPNIEVSSTGSAFLRFDPGLGIKVTF